MLTKQCRSVLKNLKILTRNTDDIFYFSNNVPLFRLHADEERIYDFSAYKSEINSILDQLLQENFVQKTHGEKYFSLTQKGLHPNQFILRDFLGYIADKWIEVVALIVSIVALAFSVAAFRQTAQPQPQTANISPANAIEIMTEPMSTK